MTTKNISVQLNFDQELTPCDEPSQRILEIALQTPAVDKAFRRLLLNLALVLDRSGSMSGTKLDYVKQAAAHVVSLLEDTDRIALVVYDDKVQVLFASAPLLPENRNALLEAIRSVYSGNTTNLYRGWLTGCEQIAEAPRGRFINRTLLLTDGLANVEITDPEVLAFHARNLAQRGVFTSTFGVGDGFNEHLLEDMANQGEGRFHFIESPRDVPNIFESEFKEMLTIFAHEVEVTISYSKTLGVTVLGGWHYDCPEPGKLRVYLGSLSANKGREIFLKLSIPGGEVDTELPLKVDVRAKGENGELMESSAERIMRLTNREEADAAPKNEALLKRFAEVELADRAAEALKLEREGKRKEASEMLANTLKVNSPYIVSDLGDYYRGLSQRMKEGMNELDRKRSHSESYKRKQRREDT